jgi:hypothetical protein
MRLTHMSFAAMLLEGNRARMLFAAPRSSRFKLIPMIKISRKHMPLRNSLLVMSGMALIVSLAPSQSSAEPAADSRPTLLITNDPVSDNPKDDTVYNKPARTRDIGANEVINSGYYSPTSTAVSGKVQELEGQLGALQRRVSGLSNDLQKVQKNNEQQASEYYASIATVNTQLQSGTTPGNPRLVQRVEQAGAQLDSLNSSVVHLNQLATDTAETASEASFLMESARAAYSLSGAVEEDHVRLAKLEDSINNTVVTIERVLNNVNDDITRTSSYLSSERNNLRTLSLAVTNGDLYGKSLSDRPFSSAGSFQQASADAAQPATSSSSFSGGPRPLVKIRFDRKDVEYEQPVYMAVNEALQRYPNAYFDLVAITPTQGNAAEVAIESTRARRNAERVLRTLTQMGLPLDRVELSYSESPEAPTNEVHLYIR